MTSGKPLDCFIEETAHLIVVVWAAWHVELALWRLRKRILSKREPRSTTC